MRVSAVWRHFVKVDEGRRVRCKECNKLLKYNKSTTTLSFHLRAMHGIDTAKSSTQLDVSETASTIRELTSEYCFLCGKSSKLSNQTFQNIETCKVPASGKPIQVVLQHLANCVKTNLVFQGVASICLECCDELAEYDNLMVNLLSFQKRLTERLRSVLSGELKLEQVDYDESISEAIIVEDDGQIEDAFNPDLDAKEEFIEIVGNEENVECNVQDEESLQSEKGIDDDDDDDWMGGDSSLGEKNQECVVCGLIFKTKSELSKHISSAHNIKQFICPICGVVRRDEEYLELHMNVHDGKTENECRYCEKRFTRPVNTLRHMRKHWDKKEYQCEKCGERFSLDNMLYNHRMRHEAEENPLICSICNQSFRSRKTYNHHMLIHQENRPRHHCTHCSKSFTERYTLKMHMRTHNIELPSCRSRVAQLLDEQEQNETKEAVSTLISKFETTSPQKEFRCVICSRIFENKENLEKHLESDHDVILDEEQNQ
ncbi:serendipity locus protein delta-like isoform X1 [Anastrepha obliqua]|uniref:serendipity locus protein delta-like isoform X1 n=1 Tax=Anastrepha obliqua TaxID=95512 RepID=UPI00240A93B1|nr:serendipity locus protein delta-like isoform X1 [Anastrepha obliqua]XP_054747660.1 serendipity locus protein delta-like isoform X1 [Anastrepha obliqua]